MMISYEPTPLLPLPLPSPILHWKVDSLPLDYHGSPTSTGYLKDPI